MTNAATCPSSDLERHRFEGAARSEFVSRGFHTEASTTRSTSDSQNRVGSDLGTGLGTFLVKPFAMPSR